MAVAYGSGDPLVKAFADAFRAKYHQDPDVYAAYAYDALFIIAAAIQKGGYSGDGIKKALYNIHDFRGVTGTTGFDSNGEVDKPFAMYQVVNANFISLSWNTGDVK
jgi:branched-chain amino acid transport system substrate-binding protein